MGQKQQETCSLTLRTPSGDSVKSLQLGSRLKQPTVPCGSVSFPGFARMKQEGWEPGSKRADGAKQRRQMSRTSLGSSRGSRSKGYEEALRWR